MYLAMHFTGIVKKEVSYIINNNSHVFMLLFFISYLDI